MLPQSTYNASEGNSDDDDENDGQQCDRGHDQASIVSAGAKLDDVEGDRGRNAMPPSLHHHDSSGNEYFNFDHLSRSCKKRRTSISSNDAVFMSLSPSSPSHYFSSCSEAEDFNSSSPIIHHHHHSSNSRPHQSPSITTESSSPNAKTPRIGGSGGDIGVDHESRRKNTAREILQEKIDDNSYAASAWWFLSSNSDSFGYNPDKKPRQQPPQQDLPPSPLLDINENGHRRIQLKAKDGSISTNTTMSNYEDDMRSDGWMDQITYNTDGPGVLAKAVLPMSNDDGQKKKMSSDGSSGISMNNNAMHNATSLPQTPGGYTSREPQFKRQKESLALNSSVDKPLVGNDKKFSLNGLVMLAGTYVPPSYHGRSSMKPVEGGGGFAEEDNWDMTMAADFDRKRKKSVSIEWTPPDSSYGAAVPACGWIPKRARKFLEVVFFVLSVALLIFVLVKAGLELRSSGSGSGSSMS